MVPMTMRIPVESSYVFPSGALCLGVEPVKDFDAKGSDTQARDRDSGRRLWLVRVMDLDPQSARFGGSQEVRVKIAADQAPVPPPATVQGMPPLVEFTGVTITPYVNSQRRCTERCRARLGWSVRAESVTPAQPATTEVSGGRSAKAAA